MRDNSQVYSFLKSAEGGPVKKELLEDLKALNIKAESTTSPYIGHTGIRVWGGKRIQKKAERIILGKFL